MIWATVDDYGTSGWIAGDALASARHYCSELEKGAILIFSAPPFALPRADLDFLTTLRPAESRLHKNISYRPGQDLLRGFGGDDGNEARVRDVMRRYAAETRKFVTSFLTPYAGKFQMDYASFRAFEEEGRGLPVHQQNALLHVDAFP